MLSWKLWRALNRPAKRTPLYKRAYARQGPPPRELQIRIPLMELFKNTGLVILPVVLIIFGTPILLLLYYLALLLAPVLLPVANTIYGLVHAYSASGNIAREREQQTYDVLCASPPGILGMHWSYCTGWIHYHWIARYAIIAVLITGIIASIFGLSPQMIFGVGQISLGVGIVRALAISAIFVIDYAQTLVLSSLVALIVPTYAENEANARLWAVSLLLGLQLAVYVPTLMLGLYALPTTFNLMGIDPAVSSLLIPLLLLAFFVILREMIITGLWHTAKEQLSTTKVELDAITRVAL
jgi:hypothetical protein